MEKTAAFERPHFPSGRPSAGDGEFAERAPSSAAAPPSKSPPSRYSPASEPGYASVSRPSKFEERSSPAPTLYFAPHIRSQANEWIATGSLALPGCSSPRHARALQRTLLLALFSEPGFGALPEGLRQRAQWLFFQGWESSAEDGHEHREVDDVAILLGMPDSHESRRILSASLDSLMPAMARAKRPTRPPRRLSSRPGAPLSEGDAGLVPAAPAEKKRNDTTSATRLKPGVSRRPRGKSAS